MVDESVYIPLDPLLVTQVRFFHSNKAPKLPKSFPGRFVNNDAPRLVEPCKKGDN